MAQSQGGMSIRRLAERSVKTLSKLSMWQYQQ